jgi:hypothetical protein
MDLVRPETMRDRVGRHQAIDRVFVALVPDFLEPRTNHGIRTHEALLLETVSRGHRPTGILRISADEPIGNLDHDGKICDPKRETSRQIPRAASLHLTDFLSNPRARARARCVLLGDKKTMVDSGGERGWVSELMV